MTVPCGFCDRPASRFFAFPEGGPDGASLRARCQAHAPASAWASRRDVLRWSGAEVSLPEFLALEVLWA